MEIPWRPSKSTTATRPSNPNPAFVPFPADLQPVRLVRRRNRFTVDVLASDAVPDAMSGATGNARGHACGDARGGAGDGGASEIALHLPNSGRMTELLQPGALGLAHIHPQHGRKTAGTLLLVQYNGRWVSVDARMPNRLFARCLETGVLPSFRGYTEWKAEVAWGKSRVDFLLDVAGVATPGNPGPGKRRFLVETKSCNLVERDLALFPDAPTTRGARHLWELTEAVAKGYRAAVVWFVQRDDARAFAPHVKADPDFAHALKEARAAGVEAYAYRCLVEPKGITVIDEIPVVM